MRVAGGDKKDTPVVKAIEYVYDVLGRRIAQKVDDDGDSGGTQFDGTAYVYDGPHRALEFDLGFETEENGGAVAYSGPTRRYLYGPAVDQVLAIEEIIDSAPNKTRWTLTDSQGSVRVLYGDATDKRAFDYTAFGEPLDVDMSVDLDTDVMKELNLPFFTGRPYDHETGFYYFRSRDYDPGTHRFISQDPIGFGGGDPNLYRYVGNSPANGTDPSGEFVITAVVVGSLLVFSAVGMLEYSASQYDAAWETGFPDEEILESARFWHRTGEYTGAAGILIAAAPLAPTLLGGFGAKTLATSYAIAGIQTTIEAGVAGYFGESIDPFTTFGKNFVFNAATANIGGTWGTGGRISATIAGYGVRKTAETTLDTAWDAAYYGKYNVGERFAFNLGANLAGDAVFKAVGRGLRGIGNRFAPSSVAEVSRASTRFTNLRTAAAFLKDNKYFDGTQWRSLSRAQRREIISGIDLSKPVRIRTLEPGTQLLQDVRMNGRPGPWFRQPGTSASQVGIWGSGRQTIRYKTTLPTRVLESRARSMMDFWTRDGFSVPTEGGGIQYYAVQGYKIWPE